MRFALQLIMMEGPRMLWTLKQIYDLVTSPTFVQALYCTYSSFQALPIHLVAEEPQFASRIFAKNCALVSPTLACAGLAYIHLVGEAVA